MTYRGAVYNTITKCDTDRCLGTNCCADNKDNAFLAKEQTLRAEYDYQLDAMLAESRKGQTGIAPIAVILATSDAMSQNGRI